ncbi:MAG: hypothetical protein E6Q34_10170 [Burkholderiaceae bacterium]|nr:MAG: hypothetical protein E6Q34_10170 [Burkholderiaceae bacterium]
MPSPKSPPAKKDELLQLRIDKALLDRLSGLAEESHLPLSVMLRSWLTERLSVEDKRVDAEREEWVESRLASIKARLPLFDDGPLLVTHGYSLAPNKKLDLDYIQSRSSSLLLNSRGATGQINQFGFSITKKLDNGRILSEGQAFKVGRVESIYSIPVENHQILGKALDHAIVEIIQSLSVFFQNSENCLPLVFKVALLAVENYSIVVNPTTMSSPPSTFSSSEVFLSDVLITSFEQIASETTTAEHMIDVIDELWHAAGQRHSLSFDDKKKWLKRR